MLNLFFKPLKGSNAKRPIQAHENDAGWDIFSLQEEIVYPGTQKKLSTGISVQAKFVDPNDAKRFKIKFQVEGTSGNASKLGIFPIGGVVDQDYIGEIGVVLVNATADPVKIEKGKKIAQLVPEVIPRICSVSYLGEDDEFESTERGNAGFGSTGTANS
jgi:dUTP pyrophosphatase